MYETHFGLKRRPFPATLDGECYYPATGHERALVQLHQAILEQQGLALLTGEPGTGKTLLCHRLLQNLPEETSSAFLTNTHVGGRAGLLQALLYDLGLPYEGRGEQELRLALTDFLLQNYRSGRRAVVVVDEAQHLAPDLLEELRLLGNLEARGGKALQAVLVAQPGIWETLARAELAGFCQRLAVRPRLDLLGLHEAADYLAHHVRIAGGRPESIFSEEAMEVLAQGSRGVPRVLNQAAHQAMTLAFTDGSPVVDAEAAVEALALLGLNSAEGANPASVSTFISDPGRQNDAAEEDPEPGVVLSLGEATEAGPAEKSLAGEDGRPHRLFASPPRPA